MLAYIPTPFRGELFYSLIARLLYHTSLKRSDIARELYSTRDAPTSIFLPTRLDKFCHNVREIFDAEPDELIQNLTIWPYISRFVKQSKHSKIFACIKSSQAGFRLSNLLGFNGSDVYLHKFPKYCPACYVEILAEHKESFWFREHQIPNMLICVQHNCFLKDPVVDFSGLGKNPLLVPSDEICTSRYKINRDPRIMEIAVLMQNILLGDIKMNFDYRSQAIELGYTRHGYVARDLLEDEFYKYYSINTVNEFLKGSIRKDPRMHVSDLVNDPARVLNPVKHLLLQNFFERTGHIGGLKVSNRPSDKNVNIGMYGKHRKKKYSYKKGTHIFSISMNQKSARNFASHEISLLERLETKRRELLNNRCRSRISKSFLCRACDITVLDSNLPRVKKFLDASAESIQQFQIRRIDSAFNKLRKQGRKLTQSNILAMASIWKPSPKIVNVVQTLIRNQFDKLPN